MVHSDVQLNRLPQKNYFINADGDDSDEDLQVNIPMEEQFQNLYPQKSGTEITRTDINDILQP